MTRRTEQILWGVVLLLVIGTVAGWRYGMPVITVRGPNAEGGGLPMQMFDTEIIASAAERSAAQNPFRLNRSPARVPFGTPDMPPAPPAPPRPSPLRALALKGVVGGPPWRAILSGVPGHPANVVVSAGDTLSGLRIKQVRPDAVVVADADSTLTLTLQRVWQ